MPGGTRDGCKGFSVHPNGEVQFYHHVQSNYRAYVPLVHQNGGGAAMSGAAEDPRCPECGGKIGATATYCMHCSADLTDELAANNTDDDGAWDSSETQTDQSRSTDTASTERGARPTAGGSDQVLDPDGIVDNTLTVVVGIGGGMVVGFVGTAVLLALTGSGWAALFGLVTWLGSTAYLVRRRTVQGAISKGAYAVAVVLLVVPLVALSPLASMDGGMVERGSLFVVLLVFVAVPAGIAALVGWVASKFVPDEGVPRERT
jgi:hypothetical protein